jgi:hypothetical protein
MPFKGAEDSNNPTASGVKGYQEVKSRLSIAIMKYKV